MNSDKREEKKIFVSRPYAKKSGILQVYYTHTLSIESLWNAKIYSRGHKRMHVEGKFTSKFPKQGFFFHVSMSLD